MTNRMMRSRYEGAWARANRGAAGLVATLALGACADSHALRADAGAPVVDVGVTDAPTPPDGCSGGAPVCHDARLECCGPATCVARAWMCPPGSSPEGSCTARGGACGIRSCGRPTDCVAVPESCCGTCGVATPDDVTAVNRDFDSAYRSSACAGSLGCDFCAMPPDAHLVATCALATAQCAPIDLGAPEWAGCTADAECVLRVPGCCACSPGTEPVALRLDRLDELAAALCDPDSGCLGCAPDFTPRLARCEAGTCVVR